MLVWSWGVLLVLAVWRDVLASSVPLTAGTPEFAVTVVSPSVSVVCTATSAVTCQAVKVQDANQTVFGAQKTIDSFNDYVAIQSLLVNSDTLILCFTTSNDGGRCVTIEVSSSFGLLGDPLSTTSFCSTSDSCSGMSLTSTSVSTEFLVCYAMPSTGACSFINTLTSTANRSLVLSELWLGTPSVFTMSSCLYVLCVIIQPALGSSSGTGNCRLFTGTTLKQQGSTYSLGSVSVVDGAYIGSFMGNPGFMACYLSASSQNLYCSGIEVISGTTMNLMSTGSFVAQYSALFGINIQYLSGTDQEYSTMVCIATIETGSQELVCTLVNVDSSGTVVVDVNEMVVDEYGFYFQNVPLALLNAQSGGAYLQTSTNPAISTASGMPYLADVTVLPDFQSVFAGGLTPVTSTISSLGCVNVGLNSLDLTRFCVGTAQPLQNPPVAPPPFPPVNYCNVALSWECTARRPYCIMAGSKCMSKYACGSEKSAAKCNILANAGGLCVWADNSCQPTYAWNAAAMCQALTPKALCNSSPGCIWAANSCYPSPYCQYNTAALCTKSPGCSWTGTVCGISGV